MQRTDSLEKTLMLGKIGDRRRRGWERTMMLGWHHQPNGQEFEQTPGDGEGQGSRACFIPWGRKESDWAAEQQQSGHWDLTDVENLLQPTIKNIYSYQEDMNILQDKLYVRLQNKSPQILKGWNHKISFWSQWNETRNHNQRDSWRIYKYMAIKQRTVR